MKRHYYIEYTRNFANTYNLYHTPADFTPPPEWEWERITRKEAERLARAERYLQKHNPAFAGYASAYIMPYDFDPDIDNVAASHFYIDNLCIIRR